MRTNVSLATPRHRRSPHIAAVLSFLWPGLGQWYGGRAQAAALFGVPVLLILALVALQAVGGVEQLAVLLITPSSALTVLILVGLIGGWRLLAIANAMIGYGERDPWRSGRTGATFAILAALVIVTHSFAGYVAWAFYDATSRIFVAENGPDGTPAPGGSGASSQPPGAYNPDSEYLATPLATPQSASSRINVLLTGIDAASNRSHSLTDTMLVVSVDPALNQVAMISFPRDIANFELWDGRVFKGKINSLMATARSNPELYPDGPLPTLQRELGYLLGVPIHYYAAVDLEGFSRMIDIVGGVTVDNPRLIDDPRYRWLDGTQGFRLSAGVHDLDGRTALAYVRSRQGAGDNDFTRARRQQQVLRALRAKLVSPAMLPKVPAILDAAGDTIRTNFPSDRIGEMLDIGTAVNDETITQVVLGPPYAKQPPPGTTNGVYTLMLDMDRLAKLSIKLFGSESAYIGG
ncbi:MAG TPA: LCP family protein [Candidatus Limnocylindrales bacterium]|nr:LCP family protein [Candidatus Limnocylindrales bacterium]